MFHSRSVINIMSYKNGHTLQDEIEYGVKSTEAVVL